MQQHCVACNNEKERYLQLELMRYVLQHALTQNHDSEIDGKCSIFAKNIMQER